MLAAWDERRNGEGGLGGLPICILANVLLKAEGEKGGEGGEKGKEEKGMGTLTLIPRADPEKACRGFSCLSPLLEKKKKGKRGKNSFR